MILFLQIKRLFYSGIFQKRNSKTTYKRSKLERSNITSTTISSANLSAKSDIRRIFLWAFFIRSDCCMKTSLISYVTE